MKILIRQFLAGKLHSWSEIGKAMSEVLYDQNHNLHLFSTDGNNGFLSKKLEPHLIGSVEEDGKQVLGRLPDNIYDCQISYTCIKNFQRMLGNGNKNRFGWWVYEWNGKNVLPNGFAKGYKHCDILFTPSEFGKDIFINSGVPADVIKVLPHGIDTNLYLQNTTMKLPTDKKFIILSVLAQTHSRKNIPGMLEAYGKAFTNKDDVCLLIKAKDKPIKYPFDVSLNKCLQDFYKTFPNHAEVKVLSNFIEDMSALYRSVHVVFTMSHCEGYYIPGTEAICGAKLNIAPGYGGQLDFLNSENSLLIEGKEERADPKSMYWESKSNAIWFKPSIEDAVNKLQRAYKEYDLWVPKLKMQQSNALEKFSWTSIVNEMMSYAS